MVRQSKRTGAVVLEAIICLPILVIAILAIVEMGLLSSNQAVVHAASAAGADVAVSLGCSLPTAGAVPSEIVDGVASVLSCQNITDYCIRVEHTIGPAPPYVLTFGVGASPPAATPPATRDYVCVSVCVDNSELTPNLLSSFCLDLENS